MKRYILTLIFGFGVIAPLAAMDKQIIKKGKQEVPEETTGFSLKGLINTFFDRKEFTKAVAPMMIDVMFDETIDSKVVSKGLLKALHIEKLPITLKSGRKTTLDEFFKSKELKKMLKKVMSDLRKEKFSKKRFPKYLKALKKSLKMEALTKELKDDGWFELNKDTILKAIKEELQSNEWKELEQNKVLEKADLIGLKASYLLEAIKKELKDKEGFKLKEDTILEGLKQALGCDEWGELEKNKALEVAELITFKANVLAEAVKTVLKAYEWIDPEKSIDLLIAYYSEDKQAGAIEEGISLEKLPPFFGIMLRDFFFVNKLNAALNSALDGKKFTVDLLLDCIDIDQVCLKQGYEPKDLPNADGIREMIHMYHEFMKSDKGAMKGLCDSFALVRMNRKAQDVLDQDPKGSAK